MEIKLLSQLDHPGTVTHIESFLHRPSMTLCIVMAYCEGGDLTTYLKLQKGNSLSYHSLRHHLSYISDIISCLIDRLIAYDHAMVYIHI